MTDKIGALVKELELAIEGYIYTLFTLGDLSAPTMKRLGEAYGILSGVLIGEVISKVQYAELCSVLSNLQDDCLEVDAALDPEITDDEIEAHASRILQKTMDDIKLKLM